MAARPFALLAFAALLGTTTAAAQSSDALVLPRGMVAITVEGSATSYGARFDAGGSRAPLAAPLRRPLTAATFAPLRTLSTGLAGFLAGGSPVTEQTLTLGAPDIRFSEGAVRAPLRLSVGLLPRIEIGAGIPIERGERVLERVAFPAATVGANPDPTRNAQRLAALGSQWAELGRSRLLPTDSSALGRALQRRVRDLGGQALDLPDSVASEAVFQALLGEVYGVPPLASRLEPWRVGDAELFARVLLWSTFGQAPFPTDSVGRSYRVALRVAARLPTGVAGPDTALLVPLEREAGRSGVSVAVAGDLFAGRRLWGSASVRYSVVQGGELLRRSTPPADPLAAVGAPVTVSVEPGDELEVRLSPRARLEEVFVIGVDYRLLALGATTYRATDPALAAALGAEGGLLHRAGLGIRYTTLPVFMRGATSTPVEVSLEYARSLAGPEGVAAGGVTTVSVTLLPVLWGRQGREPPRQRTARR